MVRKIEESFGKGQSNDIKADVIILGCSLPGIVTAHKLKRKFGDTMDIVVLDMAGQTRAGSKCNVSFFHDVNDESISKKIEEEFDLDTIIKDDEAKDFLTAYAREFCIQIPQFIIEPAQIKPPLNKLFQHTNGSIVYCPKDYHDFTYLNVMEKYELEQYQSLLDHSMRSMFQLNREYTDSERKRLMYYDKTTMEQHITDALLFSTSREIMRTTVRLVCGTPAHSISVLFYLHQCYRSNSSRNHLDGDNTRFREKILGYCRKRLAIHLQRSVANITLLSKPIEEIRTYSDEQVILKTMKGETNYICNLLAMALRPDELNNIRVEDQLLSKEDADRTRAMTPGQAKKFVVQFEENFWARQGYSGDILSIQGPIIWAMERPRLSATGSKERYATLIGYLKVPDDAEGSRDSVLEQLAKLFGEEALTPVSYKETDIADVFVPRCGDYVALRKLTCNVSDKHLLEWGTLDVFADGDVASALQAGHNAYLHLLSSLRPQAQTFEDLSVAVRSTYLANPFQQLYSKVNYWSSIRFVLYTSMMYLGIKFLRSYFRK